MGDIGAIEHHYDDLIAIFNQTFSQSHNTRLVRGGDEPLYLPADDQCSYHQVIFAHGFFSSALHEIAHWCIAGEQRCQLVDYGYWYVADGRNAMQQREFEKVEVKPQALEWILSHACAKPFRVSVDNLNGEAVDSMPFRQAVYQQVLHFCERGLPKKAQIFYQKLCLFYQRPGVLSAHEFSPPQY